MVSTKSKQARRLAGICTDCSDKAEPNRTKCKKHLAANYVASSKTKEQYVKDGRCKNCGRVKDPFFTNQYCYCHEDTKERRWN